MVCHSTCRRCSRTLNLVVRQCRVLSRSFQLEKSRRARGRFRCRGGWMAYQDIVVNVVDGVSTITINRPDNANKLRFQTARELLDALRNARETSDVGVVV